MVGYNCCRGIGFYCPGIDFVIGQFFGLAIMGLLLVGASMIILFASIVFRVKDKFSVSAVYVLPGLLYKAVWLGRSKFKLWRHCFKMLCPIILLYWLVSPAVIAAGIDASHAYKLQSDYSYQFLKFVSWKPALNDSKLTFCVLSKKRALISQLSKLTNKKTAWGGIDVRVYKQTPTRKQLSFCNTAFIDADYAYGGIKSVIDSSNMLTISRDDSSIKSIGIFIFFMDGGDLKFKINLRKARNKGIDISSSLLILAAEVVE